MRILVAGASGAIGRRLLPLLLADGHAVTGITRAAERAAAIESLGARAVVADVFDAEALRNTALDARPEVVINQLTDLPRFLHGPLDPAVSARNARIRIEGTRNLTEAATAAGARRLIAQSIAFIYADNASPNVETDALASANGHGPAAVTARGIRALEEATLNAPGIDGVVLRYGRLYGPGTWFEGPQGPGSLHVDAAAQAARLAVGRGAPGIYNIADDDGRVTIDKARTEFGFNPDFRSPTGGGGH
jgi:nucleoside-diphosphate-sugar epimerase